MALPLLSVQIIVSTRAQTTEFSFQLSSQGEVQILSLQGYMGNAEFCQVEGELAQMLEHHHRRVIVDLARLLFTTAMSQARLLVGAREFNRHGGELKLVGMSPFLGRLAGFAGFGRRKHVETDVMNALKVMSQMPNTKPHPSANKK